MENATNNNSSENTESVEGGFTLVPASSLASLLYGMQKGTKGTICFRASRTFFACLSMYASRYAAHCTKRNKKQKFLAHYSIEEIHDQVGGLGGKYLREDLQTLKENNVLEFSEKQIEVLPGTAGGEDLLRSLAPSRSKNRKIPVPRRVLDYLRSCSCPSVAKTIIAILLRGLSLKKDGIKAVGTIKASLIASVTGISLRAAKAARKALVELGFITADTNSVQNKLNKTGAYFRINTKWKAICSSGEVTTEGEETEKEEIKPCSKSEFAPPTQLSTGEFAPPYKDLIPTKVISKYQNLSKVEKARSGVLIDRKEVDKKSIPLPTLKDIQKEDFFSFPRLEMLRQQAVQAGWITDSENMKLNWFSAAVRARSVLNGNSVRIFVGIVRNKLWGNITNSQEEYARAVINKFREKKIVPSKPSKPIEIHIEKPKERREAETLAIILPGLLQGIRRNEPHESRVGTEERGQDYTT